MRTLATGVIISFVRSLRALLSSFLSLCLFISFFLPSSSHPVRFKWGPSLRKKTPAPTGEIGREGGGMRSRGRGEEARVQSIEKLSECERAPGRRVDKIRRGSHLPAELERGQGNGASNLVNFRPSIRKTCRAELWADKTLWPTCYIEFDFVFCVPLSPLFVYLSFSSIQTVIRVRVAEISVAR